jgi:hypothetical protein
MADPDLAAQARNNTLENFRLVFDPKFLNTIVTRMDANDAIVARVLVHAISDSLSHLTIVLVIVLSCMA